MKKFLIALNIVVWSVVCFEIAHAEAVIKEVCTLKVDKAGKAVMDKKTGKQAEDCKKIKTHKKVEGDKVPEPAKKK
jgi:hypothetical protein